MKKINILIPYDENWYLGGNHFFNSLIAAFTNYNDSRISYTTVSIDNLNDTAADGVLMIRCHAYDKVREAKFKKVYLFHDDFHKIKYRTIFPSRELAKIIDFVDIYFSTYLNYFDFKIFNKYHYKSHWVPFSVSEDILINPTKNWIERKDEIFLSGFDSLIYPFRQILIKEHSKGNISKLNYIKHPGYHNNSGLFANGYYEYLKNIKSAIVTTVKAPYNFSVMKYFEIPACGCLPFIENNPELSSLGFVDGKNCVIINRRNFKRKFNILNSPLAAQIASNAYEHVKLNHTHNKRINYISDVILNNINNK
jgi:hypothetical protein